MDRKRRLAVRLRAWSLYWVGLGAWALLEIALLLSHTRLEFIATSRQIGIWAIGLTVAYKLIIQTIMVLTVPKTTLDRRWIWHLDSTLAFFALVFVAATFPEWLGIPKPGRPPEGYAVSDRLYLYNVIWFQLWGSLCWSAFSVLISTWQERQRFFWSRRRRALLRYAPQMRRTTTQSDVWPPTGMLTLVGPKTWRIRRVVDEERI